MHSDFQTFMLYAFKSDAFKAICCAPKKIINRKGLLRLVHIYIYLTSMWYVIMVPKAFFHFIKGEKRGRSWVRECD